MPAQLKLETVNNMWADYLYQVLAKVEFRIEFSAEGLRSAQLSFYAGADAMRRHLLRCTNQGSDAEVLEMLDALHEELSTFYEGLK